GAADLTGGGGLPGPAAAGLPPKLPPGCTSVIPVSVTDCPLPITYRARDRVEPGPRERRDVPSRHHPMLAATAIAAVVACASPHPVPTPAPAPAPTLSRAEQQRPALLRAAHGAVAHPSPPRAPPPPPSASRSPPPP